MYVLISIPWIAFFLNADDSFSDIRNKKRDSDTYKAKVGEIGRRRFEVPQR